MSNNRFCADYAKRGTAACKKCKQKMEKGALRLGKIVPNPFSDGGGDMKQWFHVGCMFETFLRARATTKKIEDPSDIEGWEEIEKDDQEMILKHISDVPTTSTPATKKPTPSKSKPSPSTSAEPTASKTSEASSSAAVANASDCHVDDSHRDNSFREFRRLCAKLAEEPSYNAKTKIVSDFFSKGTDGVKFRGDLYLWVKLLLPGFVKRVYNLQSKQLVNHFSHIFGTDVDDMVEDLEKGDVADTVQTFFEQSSKCPPAKKSKLSIRDVDRFLEELTRVTKDDDQIRVLKNIATVSTSNDLKAVIRLIKKDLRINAGAKHILEGVHKDAYEAFQTTRNLNDVIDRVLKNKATNSNGVPGLTKALSIRASLMTPVLPMLAEACKSVDYAMKKCPNGMYAEIKYDGERVQVHKQENQFSYFSRSLKPVLPHKIGHFKEYIPQAFPHGQDLILDSEVLLIDTHTSTPLPFGTLGVHKKAAFKDANVCLFVFDCIHFNGEDLMDKPLEERRRILEENMTEVPNHVQCSEMKSINNADDLKDMIMEVLRKGLEGLVLKDRQSTYEPGKRHWLKVKKDYLAEGVMADSADLVVLGAFYGTGNKGGMMSSFLMGCYNSSADCWCTVTKVSGGHDDKTLEQLQTELKMVKISKDMSKVPSWLKVTKSMVPDFVCEDPQDSQVWEIVGAEFSKAEIHTANGISIRFPRVTRIRRDKTWKEATTLLELKDLFRKSKDHENLPDVLGSSNSPNKMTKNGKSSENETVSRKGSQGKAKNSSPIKGQSSISQFVIKTPEKKSVTKAESSQKRKTDDAQLSTPTSKKKFNNESTNSGKELTSEILPNVFTGMKIFLTKPIHNKDVLHRYIISYDGDVIDEFHICDATHIICTDASDIPKDVSRSVKVIDEQWLIDSIKLLKPQNTADYKVE